MYNFLKSKPWDKVVFKQIIFFIFISTFALGQNDTILPSEDKTPVEVFDVEEAWESDSYGDYITTQDLLEEGYVLNDSIIANTKFKENFQAKYATAEFDYTLSKPRESFWQKVKRKLSEWLSYFFRTSDAEALNKATIWLMRIVAIVIIGLVLYWIIRFLMNKEGSWFFSNKNKEINPKAFNITENIHEINFSELISTYETEKNFRYATRYQYLHLLKIFTDRKFLEWDPEKTNLDYINEVSADKKDAFKKLTNIFDYVWYGEFNVTEAEYERIKVEFKNLKSTA